jgi:broad specificity phosphatase PhoE
MIRHAQSQEDVDPNVKNGRGDHQISITELGKRQASNTIKEIRRRLPARCSVQVYSSPSNRVLETARIVSSGFSDQESDIIIEPRIRNLDWGNVTQENLKEIERERYKAGVLHYQFPGGDHSPTFVRQIGEFVDELLVKGRIEIFPENVIILTHGFAMRVITKFLLGMSDDDFRWISNPPNCYVADFLIGVYGEVKIESPLPTQEPV